MSAAVVQALPLMLLGDTRRAALSVALTRCLAGWKQQWSTTTESTEAVVHEQQPMSHHTAPGLERVSAGSDARTMLIHVYAQAEFIPALLYGGRVASELETSRFSGDLGDTLYRSMLKSLCEAVLTVCAVRGISCEETVGREELSDEAVRGWLRVAVQLDSGAAELSLLLHPTAVQALAPRKATNSVGAAIERKGAAIAEEMMRVEAVLGEVEVSLRDLAGLSPGDVLILDQPLMQAGSLTIQGGKKVANIYLGSCEQHRAVSVGK